MVNNHAPNAVRFYGYVQWFNAVGLVTEYLPNGDLYELLINTDAKLGALLRYRMCYEIAEGLFQIHNLPQLSASKTKVAHGDLKAKNVLLTDKLHCKIADFGSSQILTATGNTQSTLLQQTQPSKDFTAIYAPPELLKNPGLERSPLIDAYSYSMIIYLVFRRANPFGAMTQEIYLEDVKSGKVPDPVFEDSLKEEYATDKIAAEAVNVLKTVLLRCQAGDPVNRPCMDWVTTTLKSEGLLSNHHQKIQDQVSTAFTNVTP